MTALEKIQLYIGQLVCRVMELEAKVAELQKELESKSTNE